MVCFGGWYSIIPILHSHRKWFFFSNFCSTYIILIHTNLFSNFSGLLCIHCKQAQASNSLSLLLHCRTCSQMPRPDALRYKYVCYACVYSTYNSSNMKKHVNVHLGKKPFACKLCDYRSVQKISLQYHMDRHHKLAILQQIHNYVLWKWEKYFVKIVLCNGKALQT